MGNWIPSVQCFPKITSPKKHCSVVIFILNDEYFKDIECKELKFLLSEIDNDFFSQIHFITNKKQFASLEKIVKNEIKDILITYSLVNNANTVDAIISLKKYISTPFFFINANRSCFLLSNFLESQVNFITDKNIIYVEKLNNFFFHSLNVDELNIVSADEEKKLSKITIDKNVNRDSVVDFKNIFAGNHLFFFQPYLIECVEKIINQKKLQELFLEKKENSRLYDILEYINSVNMDKIYVSEK
jgi:hypothetical protein